jgi:hypothetical protein
LFRKSATVLEEKNLNFESSEKELSKESSHLAIGVLSVLVKVWWGGWGIVQVYFSSIF